MDNLNFIKDKKRQATLAMTVSLDREVGRLIKVLKEKDIYDNTMLVFLNDNGGQCNTNHAINAPYNGMKGTQYEGGIRVPFAIQWPAQIKNPTVFNKPVSSLDLLPTFLAAAGSSPKKSYPKGQKLDGINLLPYLKGEKKDRPHQTLYWKRARATSLRHRDLKLIRLDDRPAMLFDLQKDPSEQKDIASTNQKTVRTLLKKLHAWEMTLTHPRWRTAYYWIQNNNKKYDAKYRLTAD